jgi:hypothetical protein
MSFLTALVTSKIAAAVLVGGSLTVGGAATAAYTGTLPAPLQQTAHEIIAAPAPVHASNSEEHKSGKNLHSGNDLNGKSVGPHGKEARQTGTSETHSNAAPVGPDASGPAAYGLCNAFTHGGLDSSSTAYKSLADAAKDSADIATYCTSVNAPGKSADHRSETPGNSGKPEAAQKTKPHPPAKAIPGLSYKPAKPGKS